MHISLFFNNVCLLVIYIIYHNIYIYIYIIIYIIDFLLDHVPYVVAAQAMSCDTSEIKEPCDLIESAP